MKYRLTFTASGTGAFPIDMLRYDQCWPRKAEDAADIAYSLGCDLSDSTRTWRISLAKQTAEKKGGIAYGRWASFCWKTSEEELTRI